MTPYSPEPQTGTCTCPAKPGKEKQNAPASCPSAKQEPQKKTVEHTPQAPVRRTEPEDIPAAEAAEAREGTQTPSSPDILLYADLYKNAKMGCETAAKLIGKAGTSDALRQEITDTMECWSRYAKDASDALEALGAPPEQLSALDKLPAEIGITMQTLFDKSESKLAEMMINGITMGIIDLKKAQRVCSENGCSPKAYRMASDLIACCERRAERMKQFL